MRLLLIGAPGAGKGTQAERLAERFGIAHVSSGDLLRQHARDQTSLGQTIKSYVDSGDLVPDAVVMGMLRKPVVAAVEAGGYVLDGFPRTVEPRFTWTFRARSRCIGCCPAAGAATTPGP
jgi:adenylate kinase